MSKQPSTLQTTSNSSTSVPSYVSDAQQAMLGYGSSMLGNFLGQTPNYRVAGTNADQQQAYDLARQTAQNAYTIPSTGPTGPGYTPATIAGAAGYVPQTSGGAAGYTATSMGPAAQYAGQGMGQAQVVDGSAIQSLMNPYTQSVIDPTLANMRRQSDNTAAQIGAQAAASGSFGGSREAIQQAQNSRALGEQVAQLVPQLYSQGYNQAASLAQSNAAAQNAAAQFNANALNTSGQFNANALNNAAQFDAGAQNAASAAGANAINNARQFDANAQNAAGQYGASAMNNVAQANTNAYNTAAQYNASRDLSLAQLQNSLFNDQQSRQLAAATFLRQIGGDQQTQLQNILNVPLGALAAYQSLVPNQIPTTTSTVGTQPNTAQNPLMQLLGLGLTYAGSSGGSAALGSLFACDARLKKNIAPYGSDERGRPLFTFHYAWEDDDAPLTVGPMAQIEEAHDPESVVEALGIKLVRVH